MLIIAPVMGTKAHHPKLCTAFVGGVSLDHVSREGVAWAIRAAGASVIEGAQAIARLAGLVEQAKQVSQTKINRLNAALVEARHSYAEAERIAKTPIVGNEKSVIVGLIGMLDAAIAEANRNSGEQCLKDVAYLRSAVAHISAFDTASLEAALQELDKLESAAAQAGQALSVIREKLSHCLDLAADVDRRKAISRVRLNVAMERAAPRALEELHALLAAFSALTEQCDRTVKILEDAMEAHDAV